MKEVVVFVSLSDLDLDHWFAGWLARYLGPVFISYLHNFQN